MSEPTDVRVVQVTVHFGTLKRVSILADPDTHLADGAVRNPCQHSMKYKRSGGYGRSSGVDRRETAVDVLRRLADAIESLDDDVVICVEGNVIKKCS